MSLTLFNRLIFFIFLLSNTWLLAQSKFTDPDSKYIDSLTSEALEYELTNDESLFRSLELFHKAFEYVDQLDQYAEARALLYFQYHLFNYQTGNFDEAIVYGKKLNEICEDNSYTGKLFYVYQNMGKLYLQLGLRDKAIEIEKRGIDIAIKYKGSPRMPVIYQFMYNELGLTYLWFRI